MKSELTQRDFARMGGKAKVAKYGREHMAEIGRKGNAGAFARDKEAARRAQALGVETKRRKRLERERLEQEQLANQAQNT